MNILERELYPVWRTIMTMLAYSYEQVHLTSSQDVTLFHIAQKMKESGFSADFISSAIRTALYYEGVADLVFMWEQETDANEREEIIADINELIEDCNREPTEEGTLFRFNDLDMIRKDIRKFKDSLLKLVDEQGGISLLSKMTGIPQPSLSRFFNSNAMPRRQTLIKIASAMKVDAIKAYHYGV
jgi:DNA-binding phage protein